MLAYDLLNKRLFELVNVINPNCDRNTYAINLKYSHDGFIWFNTIEVFELDYCNQCICWFNDWWEGEPFIRMIGYVDLNEIFNDGDYHVLLRSFNDEKL